MSMTTLNSLFLHLASQGCRNSKEVCLTCEMPNIISKNLKTKIGSLNGNGKSLRQTFPEITYVPPPVCTERAEERRNFRGHTHTWLSSKITHRVF